MNEIRMLSEFCDKEGLDGFVSKQLKLLEMERDAEIEENKYLQESFVLKDLQRKGLCIPKLKAARISAGLFGRIIVKFLPYFSGNPISAHTINSGDIVGIGNPNADGKFTVITSGVVSNVHESFLSVALEKNSDSSDLECDEIYGLIKLANDVTYKRLKRILKTLENPKENLPLIDVLFGKKSPSTLESILNDNLIFYNKNLNDTQKEAVKFALCQKEVAILHGPPGTGKTTTLVECMLQVVSQKLKVIACAPSNIAVDNLVEKLAPYKFKIVRLGHPARLLSDTQKYSLDAIVSQYDGSDIIDDMQSEISKLKIKIENAKKSAARKSLWAENKKLLKEMKERQKSIVKQILTNADIVLCTLTSASLDGPLKHIEKNHFDICFIDECSQALEVSCWIPLAIVKKCVIAGDHNQLPPTIISSKAAKEGLSITLMERLLKLHGDSIKIMLTLQYRMHQSIMQWPSEQLYENKLKAHISVQSHLLSDLPNTESNDDTTIPLLLIDTAGCDLNELQVEDEESKGNEGEADLVFIHMDNLIKSGVKISDIAVITPYNLQVDFIKSRCSGKYSKVEIKSVDGFQGREKEAVILSLVRSNNDGEVGFLAEDRRINVAITRAKRHLAVICDTKTVSHSNFLKSFIQYCEEKGEVRSAFQYENQIGQYPIAMKQTTTKAKQSRPKPKKTSVKKDFTSASNDSSETQYEQDNEVKRFSVEEKLRQSIEDFMKSDENSFLFPCEFSAFERKIVHEIAEELGLNHISQGEREKRCIIISKTNINIPKEKQVQIENISENLKVSLTENVITNKNLNLDTNQKIKIVKTKKSNNKQSSKEKSSIQGVSENTEDDFDALLAAAVKADKQCSFDKCKKSVAVLAQVCQFCNSRFCFSHFIPEAHGCGHLAKLHARSQIRKEGKLYAGSGKPEKKVDPLKHSYLQKKLNEKINNMTTQRKTKPKG